MRSRSSVLELVVRTLALVCLGALFVLAVRPVGTIESISSDREIRAELARLTRADPVPVYASLARIPTREERDWLAALARASMPVRWSVSIPTHPTALAVDPVPGPARESLVRFAATPDVRVALSDALGSVDSLRGPTTVSGMLSERVHARGEAGTGVAQLLIEPERDERRVHVIGRANWETKFVVAALEEAGWPVSSEQLITGARGSTSAVVVRTGASSSAFDTAQLRAVVLLDSVNISGRSLRTFVQNGGGLVIAPPAMHLKDLQEILPAREVRRVAAELGALTSATPLRGLERVMLRPNAEGVVAAEVGADSLIALRRVGVGRVMLLGLLDTWRWRMQSVSDSAPEMHRRWWSHRVSEVAARRYSWASASATNDPMPVAALTADLGAPQRDARSSHSDRTPWERWLFGILITSLLVEWFSRRMRGAR